MLELLYSGNFLLLWMIDSFHHPPPPTSTPFLSTNRHRVCVCPGGYSLCSQATDKLECLSAKRGVTVSNIGHVSPSMKAEQINFPFWLLLKFDHLFIFSFIFSFRWTQNSNQHPFLNILRFNPHWGRGGQMFINKNRLFARKTRRFAEVVLQPQPKLRS